MTRLLAQLKNPVLPKSIGEGTVDQGGRATGLLIGNLVGAIFIFSFILSFLYLLTGGVRWITAAGDKGRLEEARNRITGALVGMIIVAAAWAAAVIVGQFVGIEFPNLPIPIIQ